MDITDFINNSLVFPKTANLYEDDTTEKLPLYFLAEGHAIEYINTNDTKKVIRFINTKQFVFRFNLQHEIAFLEDSMILALEWDNLIILLRKFPDIVQGLHRKIKEIHVEQLEQHQADLKKIPAERYFNLITHQAWVKQLADPADIASYLNLSVEQYLKLIAVE